MRISLHPSSRFGLIAAVPCLLPPLLVLLPSLLVLLPSLLVNLIKKIIYENAPCTALHSTELNGIEEYEASNTIYYRRVRSHGSSFHRICGKVFEVVCNRISQQTNLQIRLLVTFSSSDDRCDGAALIVFLDNIMDTNTRPLTPSQLFPRTRTTDLSSRCFNSEVLTKNEGCILERVQTR